MDEMKTLNYVEKLLERKAVIIEDIESIKTDKYDGVAEIVVKNSAYLQSRSFEIYNRRRFYNNIKYLVLAELNQSLDETNAEINKLIEFKGVDKS